jgi:FkbM family methyltransferase
MAKLPVHSFWDIGANIGHYTWLMKSVRPDIEAVLVEPLPANVALIAATIRRNKLTRTTLIPKAASSSEGLAALAADMMAGATSSLEEKTDTFERRHWGAMPKTIEIPTTTIDAMRANFGQVDLMKIDVEGHEESVLAGAEETIASDQPIMLIECTHHGHSCLALLKSIAYQIVPAEDGNYLCVPPRFQDAAKGIVEGIAG